jgi:hypothetical protein
LENYKGKNVGFTAFGLPFFFFPFFLFAFFPFLVFLDEHHLFFHLTNRLLEVTLL